MKKTYQKVRDTIESCENYGQYATALSFASLFWSKFKSHPNVKEFMDYVNKLDRSATTKLMELKEIG